MQYILRKRKLYAFVPPEENTNAYYEWCPKYNSQNPCLLVPMHILCVKKMCPTAKAIRIVPDVALTQGGTFAYK